MIYMKNYSLKDMVKLFNIPENYDLNDLKLALKIVSKLPPDKSNIPNEYFIFFHKVYKILLNFYKIKNRKVFREDFYDESEKKILEKFSKKKNFNKLFNELFEKNISINDGEGYGDWLKNHQDTNYVNKNINTYFEENHNKLSVKNNIKDYSTNNGSKIFEDNNTVYSSDIFSNLKYDDVKKAYSETFIPVSNNINKLKTLEQVKQERENIEQPLNKSLSNKIINDTHKQLEYENMQQMFSLYKSDEKHSKNKNKWWQNFKKLTI